MGNALQERFPHNPLTIKSLASGWGFLVLA